jgi:hypothetical protein
MQIKKENSFVSKLSSFFHVILPESCINFATKFGGKGQGGCVYGGASCK